MIIYIMVFFPVLMAFAAWFAARRSERLMDAAALVCSSIVLAAALFGAVSGKTLHVELSSVCGLGLAFSYDGFRMVYCAVIAFMWFMTLLFSKEYFAGLHRVARYYFFNLLTLGATMGVFLASDLSTAFIFFEIMSFTSFTWVIQEETDGAVRAANTYMAVAVIGGMVALMGMFLLYTRLGTLKLDELTSAAAQCPDRKTLFIAGVCILLGFGAKAGMFPLHIWLPKAHPVAPAPSSALLSGILTKSGIWGILAISCNIFMGNRNWALLLALIAAVTMFLGALLALFSVNLKRTLACSSMSQIGFILTGVAMLCLIGEENVLAGRGVLLHMLNHSLIKLDLFMCAGAVFMKTETLELSELRGYGRKKPLLMLSFLMGALGIGGIPLWNGYISKTLLHESILEAAEILAEEGQSVLGLKTLEWIFLISGGITVCYMTKLFVCLFVQKHPTRQNEYDAMTDYMTKRSALAISLSAMVLPILGFFPYGTMNRIADLSRSFFRIGLPEHNVNYFSLENLKGGGISIGIGALLYLFVVRRLLMNREGEYLDRWPKWLDLEELLYRPLLCRILPACLGWFSALFGENKLSRRLAALSLRLSGYAASLFGENRVTGPASAFALHTSGAVTEVLGENKVLTPGSKALGVTARTFARFCSDSLDAAVLLLRKTIYRELQPRSDDHITRSLAYKIGHRMDAAAVRHHKEKPGEERYAEKSVRAVSTLRGVRSEIGNSLSLALLALCAALVAVLVYVLILH